MKIRKSFVFFLIYIVGILLFLGLAAELFLRFLRPDLVSPPGERAKFCMYDAEIGWINKPLSFGRFKDRDFDVSVNISSQGLRDDVYLDAKTAGKFRLGVFGDSFVWGYGVEQPQIFTEVLENEMQPVEVLNFGCSGYGQDQELLLLKRVASRYQFDWILVNIHEASDFENNASFFQYGQYKPFFTIGKDSFLSSEGMPVPFQTLGMNLNTWWTDRSVAWRILGNQKIRGLPMAVRFVSFLDQKSDGLHKMNSNSPPDQLTCRLCTEIQKAASAMGGRVLFTLTPDIQLPDKQGRNQLLDDSENEQGLRDCLSAKGLKFLDLRPVFKSYLAENPQSLVTFTHDRHWNAQGHKIVAQAIKDYFLLHKENGKGILIEERQGGR